MDLLQPDVLAPSQRGKIPEEFLAAKAQLVVVKEDNLEGLIVLQE